MKEEKTNTPPNTYHFDRRPKKRSHPNSFICLSVNALIKQLVNDMLSEQLCNYHPIQNFEQQLNADLPLQICVNCECL